MHNFDFIYLVVIIIKIVKNLAFLFIFLYNNDMKNLNELSLEEKIGQLFIVGINGKNIDENIKTLITKYKIGGVILYKKNYSSYGEMIKIVNELKKINSVNKIPLFISVDQEGGRVNRMPSEFKNIKAAKKIALSGDKEKIIKSGEIIGKMLHETGINMNFAPDMDIQNFADTNPIGDRCYGSTAEEVCKNAIPVMREMQKQKVISVIKHFPGHGSTDKDSHFFLPVIDKEIEEIEHTHLVPFKQAIENGADAIMVGHLLFKKIDKKYPVSLSEKFITKYLRKKYRFNGIVVSDDIKMKAVNFFYGPKFAVVKAINAGNDIVMMRISFKDQIKVLKKITNLVSKGKIKEYKINKKVRRILKIKEKYELTDNPVFGTNIVEINKEIDAINDI